MLEESFVASEWDALQRNALGAAKDRGDHAGGRHPARAATRRAAPAAGRIPVRGGSRTERFRSRRRVDAVAQRLEGTGLGGLAAPALATVPVAVGTLRLARVAVGRVS